MQTMRSWVPGEGMQTQGAKIIEFLNRLGPPTTRYDQGWLSDHTTDGWHAVLVMDNYARAFLFVCLKHGVDPIVVQDSSFPNVDAHKQSVLSVLRSVIRGSKK